MDGYLPAFNYVIDTLKTANDFGVLLFDFNFSQVTLDDLLIRAGNNLRLPRLIIRPSFRKFRLECVRMVKPILYFPHEWVGRSDHVTETIGIEQIDYISRERTYAIAQTFEAAEKLAYRLLAYAEMNSNIVTSQDCWLTYVKHGKKVVQSVCSLPASRDNSTSREYNGTEKDGAEKANTEKDGAEKANTEKDGAEKANTEKDGAEKADTKMTDTKTTIRKQPYENGHTEINRLHAEMNSNVVTSQDCWKVLNAKRTLLEVPVNSFTISHVLGAAFIGMEIGTDSQNLKIRELTEPRYVGRSIRIGPGIYEYDDGDRKFTSSHLVSLFSLDLSSDVLDKRLTIAGLCYAFYAKKAIVRIATNGSPEGLSAILKNGATKRKLIMVFRRVYRRLVLPIDEWVSDSLTQQQPLPLSTRESALLQNALSGLIDVANDDKIQNGKHMKISSEERLVAFRVALHICMQFITDLVRCLLDE